jgi:hypothetical protein
MGSWNYVIFDSTIIIYIEFCIENRLPFFPEMVFFGGEANKSPNVWISRIQNAAKKAIVLGPTDEF